MRLQDRVAHVLAQANPVRDPSQLTRPSGRADLRATIRKELDMQKTAPDTGTDTMRTRRVASIAAVAALMVASAISGAVAMGLLRSDAPPAATTPPVDDAGPGALTPEEAVAAVRESIDLRNAGDVGAWMQMQVFPKSPGLWSQTTLWVEANEQIRIDGSCQFGETSASGRLATVLCPVEVTNDVYSAAGLELTGTLRFWVDEYGRIDVVEEDFAAEDDITLFQQAFFVWLHEHHPDVADGIERNPYNLGWPESSAAVDALPYVDEFIAESDDYPRPAP